MAGNDWDTYEVARATGITLNGTTYVSCVFTPTTSTEIDLIDLTREQTVGTPRLRDAQVGLTSAALTDAPYIAVWNATDSDWAIYDTPTLNQAPPAGSIDYTFVASRSGTADQASFLAPGDQVVYVIVSQYDGDISSWTDYA